jgi:dTMP kinase
MPGKVEAGFPSGIATNDMTRGRFITFEGGEGAGKSTQVQNLATRLRKLGLGVVVSREPGGSAGAEAIRHVLLSGAAKPLGPHAEAILFAAARADHLRQTIRPALERGQWVISDRFVDSTRIYQGVLGNLDPRLISALEKVTIGDTMPDLTIILDVPVAQGLERVSKRRGEAAADRFEAEAFDFHKKLREAYLELADREPSRCVPVDASGDPQSVANAVWATVNVRLHPQEAPALIQDAAS